MNTDKTIAQQCLELVENIPSNEWTTDFFSDEGNKCCLHGHISRLTSDDPSNYDYTNCSDWLSDNISMKLRSSCEQFSNGKFSSASVNNGLVNKYKQKTPRSRSIRLLKDMIKAGY